jgi:hypothetical protein
MSDLWDDIKDWWDSDSFYREQIVLAVIIGAIGFSFVILETVVKAKSV